MFFFINNYNNIIGFLLQNFLVINFCKILILNIFLLKFAMLYLFFL